jgi:catechol 2,3-dioxygenase-like lactoylglutathione lyase family enzyme
MTPLRSNPVVHLELHTGDLLEARDFYAELCGWRPRDASRLYLSLELGDGFGGGRRVPHPAPPLAALRRRRRDRRGHRPGARAGEVCPRRAARGPGRVAQRRHHRLGGEIAFWQPKTRRANA